MAAVARVPRLNPSPACTFTKHPGTHPGEPRWSSGPLDNCVAGRLVPPCPEDGTLMARSSDTNMS